VKRRWEEPEQIFSCAECDWHYAERLREEAALLAQLEACRPSAPETTAVETDQHHKPHPTRTTSREGEEAAAHAPRHMRPWGGVLPPVDTSLFQ
jgi:hypothetical protein